MAARRGYSRLRVLVALAAIFAAIFFDHIHSATFAHNSGNGGVQTSYSQLDANACAPCGAPCPSKRKD